MANSNDAKHSIKDYQLRMKEEDRMDTADPHYTIPGFGSATSSVLQSTAPTQYLVQGKADGSVAPSPMHKWEDYMIMKGDEEALARQKQQNENITNTVEMAASPLLIGANALGIKNETARNVLSMVGPGEIKGMLAASVIPMRLLKTIGKEEGAEAVQKMILGGARQLITKKHIPELEMKHINEMRGSSTFDMFIPAMQNYVNTGKKVDWTGVVHTPMGDMTLNAEDAEGLLHDYSRGINKLEPKSILQSWVQNSTFGAPYERLKENQNNPVQTILREEVDGGYPVPLNQYIPSDVTSRYTNTSKYAGAAYLHPSEKPNAIAIRDIQSYSIEELRDLLNKELTEDQRTRVFEGILAKMDIADLPMQLGPDLTDGQLAVIKRRLESGE